MERNRRGKHPTVMPRLYFMRHAVYVHSHSMETPGQTKALMFTDPISTIYGLQRNCRVRGLLPLVVKTHLVGGSDALFRREVPGRPRHAILETLSLFVNAQYSFRKKNSSDENI